MVWRSVLLLACFVVAIYPKSNSAQGIGELRYKNFHFPSSVKLSWQKAFEYCRSRSMFLVTIQSREQLNAVVDFIDQSGYWKSQDQLHMWTSLNDIGEEGQYFWASTGERLRFDNWRSGEPNNVNHSSCTDEDCGVLNHHPSRDIYYSFDDRPCYVSTVFLCESMID